MKAIPIDVQRQISELAAVVDEKAKTLQLAVWAYNDALAIKLAPLESAQSEYNAAVADLRGVYTDLAETAQAYFDERSERWQEGDAGGDYAEWMNELSAVVDRLEDVDEFEIEELEEPALFDSDSFEWPENEPG